MAAAGGRHYLGGALEAAGEGRSSFIGAGAEALALRDERGNVAGGREVWRGRRHRWGRGAGSRQAAAQNLGGKGMESPHAICPACVGHLLLGDGRGDGVTYSGSLRTLRARYSPLTDWGPACGAAPVRQDRDSTSGMGGRRTLISKVREVPLHFLPAGGVRRRGVCLEFAERQRDLRGWGFPDLIVSFRNTFFQGGRCSAGPGLRGSCCINAFTCFSLLEVVFQPSVVEFP